MSGLAAQARYSYRIDDEIDVPDPASRFNPDGGQGLMPLAAFPGKRGWGYDGVLPYAPHAPYGTPEDLKRLIQAAHERKLAVPLDVVYNHFGPEGNYLPRHAREFFSARHQTPWGDAIDFSHIVLFPKVSQESGTLAPWEVRLTLPRP